MVNIRTDSPGHRHSAVQRGKSSHENFIASANSTPSRRAAHQRPAFLSLPPNPTMPQCPFSRAGSPRAPFATRYPQLAPKFCPAIQVLSNIPGQKPSPPFNVVTTRIPKVYAFLLHPQPASERSFVTPNALFSRDNSQQRRANRPPVASTDPFAASRDLVSRS